MRDLSYNQLLNFYLEHNTTGAMGEFNKTYFPNDYKEMKEELKRLKPCLCYNDLPNLECPKHKGQS